MTIRTSRTKVTFTRPFQLDGFDKRQPAGDYAVDVDEQLIEGLSFIAYRRVSAFLHLPAISQAQTRCEIVTVVPSELDAMLEFDRSATARGARP